MQHERHDVAAAAVPGSGSIWPPGTPRPRPVLGLRRPLVNTRRRPQGKAPRRPRSGTAPLRPTAGRDPTACMATASVPSRSWRSSGPHSEIDARSPRGLAGPSVSATGARGGHAQCRTGRQLPLRVGSRSDPKRCRSRPDRTARIEVLGSGAQGGRPQVVSRRRGVIHEARLPVPPSPVMSTVAPGTSRSPWRCCVRRRPRTAASTQHRTWLDALSHRKPPHAMPSERREIWPIVGHVSGVPGHQSR